MKKFRIFSLLISALVITISFSSCKKTSDDKLSIGYEKYIMPNGLQVILHTDYSDPIISYAIMYHVGSSRETPGKTGPD
jgi:zinc protease